MKRKDKFDHVLIETTGLADPGPVVQTFFMDDDMKEEFFVNGVVTLVDALHILQHIDDSHEAREQIAFADVVLLNKSDLVGPADLDSLERRIRSANALTKIYRTVNAEIDLARILDIGGFNLDHAMELDPHFLDEEEEDEHGHHHHHDHEHDSEITSVGIIVDGDCNGQKLNAWLSELVRTEGADIFRMKGVFAVAGSPDRVIFQGVHMLIDAANGGPWGDRPRQNRLVFIGRNLNREALNKGFRACLQ